MTEVVLQGSLASFKLPDVLTLLSGAKKSGTLMLAGYGRHSYVLFSNGSLVYAGSDQEKFRLGALLVRRKKITRDQQLDIDTTMRREGGRFGQIAIQQGILTDDEVHEFLKVQVSEVVYDAFVWTEGGFRFSEDLQMPDYAVTIAVDISNLIMEGARRIEEWEKAVQLLPDESVVFRVVSVPKDDKITLSADEWKVLFLVNGQRTLNELVADAEDDALNVYRIIYGLQSNRLIEPIQPPSTPDDTNRLTDEKPIVVPDDTLKQRLAGFNPDSTVHDTEDDTDLLVSTEARLSWSDVIKPFVAQFKISDGDSAGRVVALTESVYTLGRQRDNTIQISDLGISGYHARIFRTTEGYAIEDLKSRNGIWVNGGRIFHATLRHGDQVRIGATDLRYEVLIEPPKKQ
jgi:pSer/pThr/pTyr-binding forkhead associated (FHA) protein